MQTIIVLERDGLDVRAISIRLDTKLSGAELRRAVVKACTEYVQTDEGKKVYGYNCGSFNWADMAVNVPNEICSKYGFTKCEDETADMVVDWDEHLVNDDDIPEE